MNDLINLRKKNHYTCQYMSERLHISKPFYWQIENGKRRLSYSMAVKIAAVFNMKPDEIFYASYKEEIEKEVSC